MSDRACCSNQQIEKHEVTENRQRAQKIGNFLLTDNILCRQKEG